MFSQGVRQHVPESMFSQSIRQYIQQKAIKATIEDDHVINIMLKFCEVAISQTSSLKQQYKQLEGIEKILKILACMLAFDKSEEIRRGLCDVQIKLSQAVSFSEDVKNRLLDAEGKLNIHAVKMSAAMNSIMELLEKGKQNKDTQKLCSGIEVAISFLETRKKI